MGKIFCVQFQMYHLNFHTKYLTHSLKDVHFVRVWKFGLIHRQKTVSFAFRELKVISVLYVCFCHIVYYTIFETRYVEI